MNKELYVSSTPHETKVALVEDDQLAEVFFERENEYTLAGSIYKGRVTRVLPGMQSAFVDIGLERDAFLYVSDFLELPSEEGEEEEFGQIPAPRTTVDLSRPQPVPESHTVEGPALVDGPETEELETIDQESVSNDEDLAAVVGGEASLDEDRDSGEGARRWRGRRRRRGGRRGRPDEREDRPELKTETAGRAGSGRNSAQPVASSQRGRASALRFRSTRRIHPHHFAGRVDLQVSQPGTATCGGVATGKCGGRTRQHKAKRYAG